MAAADTKDVRATGKISDNSMVSSEKGITTFGSKLANYSCSQLILLRWEENAEKAKEQAVLAAEAARTEPEEPEEPEEEFPNRVFQISEADYAALLKIVEAEASGEDIHGRMLVANVVLNRVASSAFPDTVEAVVYQRKGGKAQFSPVSTGKIDRVRVSEKTIEAVERALCGEDASMGALYFVSRTYANPENLLWFERNLTRLFVYHGHEFYA